MFQHVRILWIPSGRDRIEKKRNVFFNIFKDGDPGSIFTSLFVAIDNSPNKIRSRLGLAKQTKGP